MSAVAEITRLNGAEAALKVQQQFGSIVDTIEASVQRLVPEMSFGTPPQRTSK